MSHHLIPLAGGRSVELEVDRVLTLSRAVELFDVLRELLPVISHDANESARGFVHAHLRVVYLLAESQGSTHTQLARRWQTKAARPPGRAWPFISDSGLRTRVSELVRWGLVEWSGGMGRTLNNRPSKIWQLVSEPARLAGIDDGLVQPIASVEPGSRDVYLSLVEEAGGDLAIRSSLELAALAARIAL